MRLPWIKILVLLAAVWLVAAGVIFLARGAKVTPESVTRYIESNPLGTKPQRDRERVVDKVADHLNALGYDDRRQVRVSKKLGGFFESLTPAEQTRFLDRTLPTGFKQMMDALNRMEPLKRKQFVEKALADMKKHEDDPQPDAELDANAQKIIGQGFKSFYSEANADVKMDVAPLVEQLQKNLQGGR